MPIQLTSPLGSSIGIDLVAGFFAVEQDPDDLALSPVISWAGNRAEAFETGSGLAVVAATS